MALVLPANPTANNYRESASIPFGTGRFWAAVDFKAPATVAGTTSYHLDFTDQSIWIGTNTEGGRVSAAYLNATGTKVYGSSITAPGILGKRSQIVIKCDPTAGVNGQFSVYADGALVTTQDVPADHSFYNGVYRMRVTGFTTSGQVLEMYNVAYGTTGLPTDADIVSYSNGVLPTPGAWSVNPEGFYIFSGTGYPESITSEVSGTTLIHLNTVAGETDSGSPNAPYLTTEATGGAGWQSPVMYDVDGVKLAAGATVSCSVRSRDFSTEILPKATYTIDSAGKFSISADLGAAGTPLAILFYLGTDSRLFDDAATAGNV